VSRTNSTVTSNRPYPGRNGMRADRTTPVTNVSIGVPVRKRMDAGDTRFDDSTPEQDKVAGHHTGEDATDKEVRQGVHEPSDEGKAGAGPEKRHFSGEVHHIIFREKSISQ
jgi:hypothetical protein